MEQKIQSYMSQMEAGVLCAIGEATQQLEKEVQVAEFGIFAMSTQQTQVHVGTIQGELQAQMEANHEEM